MKFTNFDQIIDNFHDFVIFLVFQYPGDAIEVFAHSEILTLDYISEVIDEVRCA